MLLQTSPWKFETECVFLRIRLQSGKTASAGALPLIHASADQVKGQRRGRAFGSLPGGVAGPAWPGQCPPGRLLLLCLMRA